MEQEEYGQWVCAPFESAESQRMILGACRLDVGKFRKKGKMVYRLTVAWPYDSPGDMPGEELSLEMEQVQMRLETVFRKDPVAVMTEIYTGDGLREWVFYTASLNIFQKKLNEALADLPELPLTFSAEEDPRWEEYEATAEIVKQLAEDD
ncbi:MAG: DUF695 domain-containing protein [Muribaculaceae bacterium]|nr:DUF695 domain-containing protein [Muribaculaceae bacterium]MDE7141590.1 DUF695 domain-containing protein [Muribaculaceae bacterium]